MSGTGSIHDLASQHYDRELKFPAGTEYAVITASYYGGKGYTTHKTAQAAIIASRRMSDYSHAIIDSDGNQYTDDYNGNLINLDVD